MKYPETIRRTPNVTTNAQNECKGACMHHTAGSYAGAVEWLCNPAAKASAHVVIAKDGRRTALAPDSAVTWHAGDSRFKGRKNCNSFLLGVEFELTVQEVQAGVLLTDDQIASMLEWLCPRWLKYDWKASDITHHAEISPGRKIDLSPENWALVQRAVQQANMRRIAEELGLVPVRPIT